MMPLNPSDRTSLKDVVERIGTMAMRSSFGTYISRSPPRARRSTASQVRTIEALSRQKRYWQMENQAQVIKKMLTKWIRSLEDRDRGRRNG
jgi:hypothetical protein